MATFVRKTKFKHAIGKPLNKESCYNDIDITKSTTDSRICCVNSKFLAIVTETSGGGSFLVIPLENVGRVPPNHPLVTGHKKSVLDLQWNPFDDCIIASASCDCSVKVWQIPEEGISDDQSEPLVNLEKHQNQVVLVEWHPTAKDVLLSSGADYMVFVWNTKSQEILIEMTFPNTVLSVSFNYNGSRFVCACKDKITRIVNPRTKQILLEGSCHKSSKSQRCIYLKENLVFTTGFSEMGERQFAIWKDSDFTEPLYNQDINYNNGVIFPFYDFDIGMIYLCGKGDSTIRYFEVNTEFPYVHYENVYTSCDPQRGMCFMPKRGVQINNNEIARLYKLVVRCNMPHGGSCQVISFRVPRHSQLFQKDLYPDTVGPTAALTAAEWMTGDRNPDPILISQRDRYKSRTHKASSSLSTVSLESHPKIKEKCYSFTDNVSTTLEVLPAQKRPISTSPSCLSVKSAAVMTCQVASLLRSMRRLKILIRRQDRRIRMLEERLRLKGFNLSLFVLKTPSSGDLSSKDKLVLNEAGLPMEEGVPTSDSENSFRSDQFKGVCDTETEQPAICKESVVSLDCSDTSEVKTDPLSDSIDQRNGNIDRYILNDGEIITEFLDPPIPLKIDWKTKCKNVYFSCKIETINRIGCSSGEHIFEDFYLDFESDICSNVRAPTASMETDDSDLGEDSD